MMWLTRQAEIAIDILVACARPQPNKLRTTRLVAELAGTTEDHAAQVVAKLSRHGYLEGSRGRAGGIIVDDVLLLIEPSLAVGARQEEGPTRAALDTVLRAAIGYFVSIFDGFTNADLAGDPSAGRIARLGCDLHTIVRNGREISWLRRHLQHAPPPAVGTAEPASRPA